MEEEVKNRESIVLNILKTIFSKKVPKNELEKAIEEYINPLDRFVLNKRDLVNMVKTIDFMRRDKRDHSIPEIAEKAGVPPSFLIRLINENVGFLVKCRVVGKTTMYELSKKFHF